MLLCLVAGCSEPVRQTVPVCASPPLRVEAPPPPAPACDLDVGWLERAERIHARSLASGHAGLSESHADLARDGEAYRGLAGVTYRRRPGAPVVGEARELQLSYAELHGFLVGVRDALAIRPTPPPERGHVYVSDTSATVEIAVDIQVPGHAVTLEVDDAQDDPAPWRVRGCSGPLPYEAQKAMTATWRGLARRLGFESLRDAAQQRAAP